MNGCPEPLDNRQRKPGEGGYKNHFRPLQNERCPFRIYTRYRSVCQESGAPCTSTSSDAADPSRRIEEGMIRGVRTPPRYVPVTTILNSIVNVILPVLWG